MNGDIKEDEEGELTYIGGRGESVIDYVITEESARERIERVEVEARVDQPVTV